MAKSKKTRARNDTWIYGTIYMAGMTGDSQVVETVQTQCIDTADSVDIVEARFVHKNGQKARAHYPPSEMSQSAL